MSKEVNLLLPIPSSDEVKAISDKALDEKVSQIKLLAVFSKIKEAAHRGEYYIHIIDDKEELLDADILSYLQNICGYDVNANFYYNDIECELETIGFVYRKIPRIHATISWGVNKI